MSVVDERCESRRAARENEKVSVEEIALMDFPMRSEYEKCTPSTTSDLTTPQLIHSFHE